MCSLAIGQPVARHVGAVFTMRSSGGCCPICGDGGLRTSVDGIEIVCWMLRFTEYLTSEHEYIIVL